MIKYISLSLLAFIMTTYGQDQNDTQFVKKLKAGEKQTIVTFLRDVSRPK